MVVPNRHHNLVHGWVVRDVEIIASIFDQVVCNLVSLNSLINELFAKVKGDVTVRIILGGSDQGAAATVECLVIPRGLRRAIRILTVDREGELVFGERYAFLGLLIFHFQRLGCLQLKARIDIRIRRHAQVQVAVRHDAAAMVPGIIARDEGCRIFLYCFSRRIIRGTNTRSQTDAIFYLSNTVGGDGDAIR